MDRRATAILLATLISLVCAAQETVLRSRSRLVLVPLAITDRAGRAVRDLSPSDLILYDNNVPRPVQMEDVALPVSLAIVVQTTPESQFVLDKLRKAAGIFGPMLTGNNGEAAVISFGGSIRTVQPFTSREDDVYAAVRRLDSTGEGGSIAQTLARAMDLLKTRPPGRRRVLLAISQRHDLSSPDALIASAATLAQQLNITIYSVVFSPFRSAFTNRVPTYCKPPPPSFRCTACARMCGNCGNQCDRPDGKPQPFVPVQAGATANILALVREMRKAASPDIGRILSSLTGGEQEEFNTRAGLDSVLERISHDLHGQYLLSFSPDGAAPGEYHRLRVEVKGRHDLNIRCRPGYTMSEN